MAITAQTIVTNARTVLNDDAGVRWDDDEMLSYVNAGRRDMAGAQPAVWGETSKRRVTLAVGAHQTLPALGVADAFALVDVTNNVTSLNTEGTAIGLVAREQLDSFVSNWRAATGAEVQNWVRDAANTRAFWVYPAVAGGKVDVCVSVTPNDLTSLTQTAVPLDMLANPLMHYVVYRAYAKDAEVAQSAALAASYLQLFVSAVGGSKGA